MIYLIFRSKDACRLQIKKSINP